VKKKEEMKGDKKSNKKRIKSNNTMSQKVKRDK
jgi:hypothetical protein